MTVGGDQPRPYEQPTVGATFTVARKAGTHIPKSPSSGPAGHLPPCGGKVYNKKWPPNGGHFSYLHLFAKADSSSRVTW